MGIVAEMNRDQANWRESCDGRHFLNLKLKEFGDRWPHKMAEDVDATLATATARSRRLFVCFFLFVSTSTEAFHPFDMLLQFE